MIKFFYFFHLVTIKKGFKPTSTAPQSLGEYCFSTWNLLFLPVRQSPHQYTHSPIRLSCSILRTDGMRSLIPRVGSTVGSPPSWPCLEDFQREEAPSQIYRLPSAGFLWWSEVSGYLSFSFIFVQALYIWRTRPAACIKGCADTSHSWQ